MNHGNDGDDRFTQRTAADRARDTSALAPGPKRRVLRVCADLVVRNGDPGLVAPASFHPHTMELASLACDAIVRPEEERGRRFAAIDHALDRYLAGKTHYYGMEAEVAEFAASPEFVPYPRHFYPEMTDRVCWASLAVMRLTLHHLHQTQERV